MHDSEEATESWEDALAYVRSVKTLTVIIKCNQAGGPYVLV